MFLDFYLENNGTTPAGDIRVNLHFPDGFQLIEYRLFPEAPLEPVAPQLPRANSLIEMLMRASTNLRPGLLGDLPVLQRNTATPNVSAFSIKPTNSFEVTCNVRKAMHGDSVFLRSVVVIFDSIAEAKSFTIDCKLICDELIKASTCQLHVVIKR